MNKFFVYNIMIGICLLGLSSCYFFNDSDAISPVGDCVAYIRAEPLLNSDKVVQAGKAVRFFDNYKGLGRKCWTLEGPCEFEEEDLRLSTSYLCAGNYTLRLAISEGGVESCTQELQFTVLAPASVDTSELYALQEYGTWEYCQN